jgi:hypothetical protein
MEQRSDAIQNAPKHDRQTIGAMIEGYRTINYRNDRMPLLGLEPMSTENTGLNSPEIEDSNPSCSTDPLLGTKDFEYTDNNGKSSTQRSRKSVCYSKLLREDDRSSSLNARTTVLNGSLGCYLASSARWRTSTSSNRSLSIASLRASMR